MIQYLMHLKLMWHYARGIAFTRKNNLKDAQEELNDILLLKNDEQMDSIMAVGFDSSKTIANLAYEIVAGEIASLVGNHSTAISHFEKAVEMEDALIYNEPSAWHIPPRHNLGAELMRAKKFKEAEAVYREDLKRLRQNGWSLVGLYKSLASQGKSDEALSIKNEFLEAWKDADIEIKTSVL